MPVFLERFILPLLVAIVVYVALANQLNLGLGERIVGAATSFGLALLVAYLIRRLQRDKRPARPVSTTERSYLREGPLDLTKIYRIHTHLQADRLAETYLGSWMRIRGKFNNISEASGRVHLSVSYSRFRWSSPFFTPSILIFLKTADERGRHFRTLKREQPVTIDGRLTEIAAYDLHLEDVELIDE